MPPQLAFNSAYPLELTQSGLELEKTFKQKPTRADQLKIVESYSAAAGLQFAEAQYNLGRFLLDAYNESLLRGSSPDSESLKRAEGALMAATKQKHPQALNLLANHFAANNKLEEAIALFWTLGADNLTNNNFDQAYNDFNNALAFQGALRKLNIGQLNNLRTLGLVFLAFHDQRAIEIFAKLAAAGHSISEQERSSINQLLYILNTVDTSKKTSRLDHEEDAMEISQSKKVSRTQDEDTPMELA